ncbi:hypothetical protein [Oenococcus sp.]|uniref:hypothetical protein n=1 Tax=Oenococcus sp. TaxID=1979414 RepID=UPI0039E91D10
MWIYQLIFSVVPIAISIYVILLGQISKRRESIPIVRLDNNIFGYRELDTSLTQQNFIFSLENIGSAPAINCSLELSYDLNYLLDEEILFKKGRKFVVRSPFIEKSLDTQEKPGLYFAGISYSEFDPDKEVMQMAEIGANSVSKRYMSNVTGVGLLINNLIFDHVSQSKEPYPKISNYEFLCKIHFEDIYGRRYTNETSFSISLNELTMSKQNACDTNFTYQTLTDISMTSFNELKQPKPEKREVLTRGEFYVSDDGYKRSDDLSSIRHPIKSFFRAYADN